MGSWIKRNTTRVGPGQRRTVSYNLSKGTSTRSYSQGNKNFRKTKTWLPDGRVRRTLVERNNMGYSKKTVSTWPPRPKKTKILSTKRRSKSRSNDSVNMLIASFFRWLFKRRD